MGREDLEPSAEKCGVWESWVLGPEKGLVGVSGLWPTVAGAPQYTLAGSRVLAPCAPWWPSCVRLHGRLEGAHH